MSDFRASRGPYSRERLEKDDNGSGLRWPPFLPFGDAKGLCFVTYETMLTYQLLPNLKGGCEFEGLKIIYAFLQKSLASNITTFKWFVWLEFNPSREMA